MSGYRFSFTHSPCMVRTIPSVPRSGDPRGPVFATVAMDAAARIARAGGAA